MARQPRNYPMPGKPEWIEFGWSDGWSGHWPETSERVIDAHGNVDYIRIVGLDEPGISIKWRCGIVSKMALSMKMRGTFVVRDVNGRVVDRVPLCRRPALRIEGLAKWLRAVQALQRP